MRDKTYTTRLQKGGALIDDIRAIVRIWSEKLDWEKQAQAIIQDNILGKNSRSRSVDVYRRAFTHRFLKGNPPEAWKIVKPLEDLEINIETLKPIYYWITARSDDLLYDFVSEELLARSKDFDLSVRVDETVLWINEKLSLLNQSWTETVKLKVARGLLAALRDFGILEGATKKKIAPIYLSLESFTYIAFALSRLGKSGEGLIVHQDWNLFLFGQLAVERMFLEAHQNGLLRYEAAGNIHRIEFSAENYEEMADVVARRMV